MSKTSEGSEPFGGIGVRTGLRASTTPAARVGVVQYDDVPTYCNQRSFSIQAGQIAELQVTTPGFVIPCSAADAGN